MIEAKDGGIPREPLGDDEIWPAVLQATAASPKDHAKVRHLLFQSFDGRTLQLTVDEAAADSARYLSTQSETVSELIRRVTGRKVRVRIDAPARRSINSIRASRTLIKEATQLPVVRKAMEIFDAVVIDVEDAPAEAQPRESQTEDSTDV